MRALFWLLTLAALAVGLALAARYNEGYVLLVLPPWRAEVSLNLFILAAIAGFFLIYLLARAASHVLACRAPLPVPPRGGSRSKQPLRCATHGACCRKGVTAMRVRRAEKIRHDHPARGCSRWPVGARRTRPARCRSATAEWAARVRSHDASGIAGRQPDDRS
jgi:HemY protein